MKRIIYANRYFENGEYIGSSYGCTGTGINPTALSLLAEEIKNSLEFSGEVFQNFQRSEIKIKKKENSKLTVILRTGLNSDELNELAKRLSRDE